MIPRLPAPRAYVDNFIFYSTDPAEEKTSKAELAKDIKVNFMGDVGFVPRTTITWIRQPSSRLSVHMTQTVFTKFSAHYFDVDTMSSVPNMMPYHSDMSIKPIPALFPDHPYLKRLKKVYRSMVGSIHCWTESKYGSVSGPQWKWNSGQTRFRHVACH